MDTGRNKMGAIRVTVHLTNAIDEALVARGVLAPHLLRSLETEALVDIGAVTLVLPQRIVDSLGLRISDSQIAQFANVSQEIIGVTEPVRIHCLGRKVVVEALVTGNEVLLGQIPLEFMDFVADCKNQRLIPNPDHPDYPVAMIK